MKKDIDIMIQMRAEGHTYQEIGEVFGITKQRVHQKIGSVPRFKEEKKNKTAKSKSRPARRRYLRHVRRRKALDKMGGRCVKCGFSDLRALQIDHINGDGRKDRKKRTYYGIISRILDTNDWQDEYQLVCANCNWIKRYEEKEHKSPTHVLDNSLY